MPNSPTVRTLRVPPPNLAEARIPRALQAARVWRRVHPSRYQAVRFALNESHRFSHPECPYSVLYVALDIETCLFEQFGDRMYDDEKAVARSLWEGYCVSAIQVPRIHVCDLTRARTLSALRVDLGALMHNNLSAPQEWGLAIQRHPAGFQGIKFRSRFNGRACLALFRRDGMETRLRETQLSRLPDSDEAADWLHRHGVALY